VVKNKIENERGGGKIPLLFFLSFFIRQGREAHSAQKNYAPKTIHEKRGVAPEGK